MERLIQLLLIALFSVSTTNAHSEPSIEWKILNPFTFLLDQVAYQSFSFQKGETAAEFVNRVSKAKQRPPIDKTLWHLSKQGHEVEMIRKTIAERIHQVEIKLSSPPKGEVCVWYIGVKKLKQKCELPIEIAVKFSKLNPVTTPILVEFSNDSILTGEITIKDYLIVGFGDSYGSGESNPDIPVSLESPEAKKWLANFQKENDGGALTGRWLSNKNTWLPPVGYAKWLDKQCHRSTFSQHILAAMRLAEMDPHQAVTILPLACSGAEIYDGILTPRVNPPGDSGSPKKTIYLRKRGAGKLQTRGVKVDHSVRDSQLNLAVDYLCVSEKESLDGFNTFYKTETVYVGKKGSRVPEEDTIKILHCSHRLIQPDSIFISIGGNDVGFAPVIAWATLPQKGNYSTSFATVGLSHIMAKPICPKSEDNDTALCKVNSPDSSYRIQHWLPSYYDDFKKYLEETGLTSNKKSTKILVTAYPNPLRVPKDPNSNEDSYCDEQTSADVLEQARSVLPLFLRSQSWDLRFTEDEIKDVEQGVMNPLNAVIEGWVEKNSWTFVDAHLQEIEEHGICRGYQRADKTKPYYIHWRGGEDKEWYPKDITEYDAYDVNRLRWFRTSSDSYLFQSDDSDAGISGLFHPDARAHAAIADALFEEIRISH